MVAATAPRKRRVSLRPFFAVAWFEEESESELDRDRRDWVCDADRDRECEVDEDRDLEDLEELLREDGIFALYDGISGV